MIASSVGGVYVSRRGWQPIVKGINELGELIWDYVVKEPWHQRMFPVPYGGDLLPEWVWKSTCEKGFLWSDAEELEEIALNEEKHWQQLNGTRG